MSVTIKELSNGYLHARGQGPCNWAQWHKNEPLTDTHIFPEAGDTFRQELARAYERMRHPNGGNT